MHLNTYSTAFVSLKFRPSHNLSCVYRRRPGFAAIAFDTCKALIANGIIIFTYLWDNYYSLIGHDMIVNLMIITVYKN